MPIRYTDFCTAYDSIIEEVGVQYWYKDLAVRVENVLGFLELRGIFVDKLSFQSLKLALELC